MMKNHIACISDKYHKVTWLLVKDCGATVQCVQGTLCIQFKLIHKTGTDAFLSSANISKILSNNVLNIFVKNQFECFLSSVPNRKSKSSSCDSSRTWDYGTKHCSSLHSCPHDHGGSYIRNNTSNNLLKFRRPESVLERSPIFRMDDKEENQALRIRKHGLSKEQLITRWQAPTCRSSVCVETESKSKREMEQHTLHRHKWVGRSNGTPVRSTLPWRGRNLNGDKDFSGRANLDSICIIFT